MHVLIATGVNPQSGSRVYHQPSEDNPDEPECDTYRPNREWVRKDPELLPNHRMCKQCSGEYTPPSQGSTKMANILSEMDPDDIGGSA